MKLFWAFFVFNWKYLKKIYYQIFCGFCASPLFLQTLGSLFLNEMQMYFHLKRGLWSTEQQSFFSTAQVRRSWWCFWFRSGLVTLFLKMSERGDSSCTYIVWMVIYWNSNVNIIIFWDTDFWRSWAVSSYHQNKIKNTFEIFYITCMNLKYMNVSLFEISYKKKMNFFTIFYFFF